VALRVHEVRKLAGKNWDMITTDAQDFHRKLRVKARRAAKAVKDKTLREIAYHSILRHLYELPRKRKRKT
jgi:hypothetical protein